MPRIPGLKIKVDDPDSNVVSTVWQHTRGAGELTGDGNYTHPAVKMLGICEQILTTTTFDNIQLNAWCTNTARVVKMSMYVRDTSEIFTLSNDVPVYEKDFAAGAFPSEVGATSFPLGENVTVAAGKYLFVVISISEGSELYLRTWDSTSSDPARPYPRFGTSYPGLLNQTWDGGRQTSFVLGTTAMQARNLEDFIVAVPSKFSTYDNDESGLGAGTVQDALDELAAGGPIRIVLPATVSAVVGDTLQLFARGIIEAQDPYAAPHEFDFVAGSGFPRYFEYLPVAGDVGIDALTVRILSQNGDTRALGTTYIYTVAATGQPASPVRVLCLGDSLVEGGEWPTELYRRLCAAGGSPVGLEYSNISFIGDRGATPKYMGYGGWRWETYIGTEGSGTMITCTHDKDTTDQHSIWADSAARQWMLETVVSGGLKFMPYGHTSAMPAANAALTHVSGGTHTAQIDYTAVEVEAGTPFWDSDTNAFSIDAWIDGAGFSGVDIVYVLLGWNGLFNVDGYDAADYATIIAAAKAFLDTLHTEYPDCLVRVMGLQVPCPIGGMGTTFGAEEDMGYYLALKRVNGLNLAYQAMCDESAYMSWCRYISIAAQFDSENNTQRTDKAVNVRNAATEVIGTNAIHPDTSGYYQIADAAFRDFIRTYCSG